MIFKLQLFSTLLLTGLIITIQFVHYPLWKYISKETLSRFEKDHQRLITPIVTILMLVEAFTAIFLLKDFKTLYVINFTALVGIWLSTIFLQVPLHQKILKGIKSEKSTKKLIQTNYIRTILWIFRAVVLTFFT